MKHVSKLFDRILLGTCYTAGGILVFLMVSICFEVVMRYFFFAPSKWIIDFAGYMQYAITLLGAAWVLQIDGHVNIDLFVKRVPLKQQTVMRIITSSVALLGCLLFGWEGLRATVIAYQRGDFLFRQVEVPLAPLYGLIPFSFALLSIEFGRKIYGDWKKSRLAQGEEPKF